MAMEFDIEDFDFLSLFNINLTIKIISIQC